MLPDPKRYWHHVERFDMSDAEKTELINMIYHAMQSGVDRAFREDAVQVALRDSPRKQDPELPDVIDLSKDNYSASDLSQTFNDKKGMNSN